MLHFPNSSVLSCKANCHIVGDDERGCTRAPNCCPLPVNGQLDLLRHCTDGPMLHNTSVDMGSGMTILLMTGQQHFICKNAKMLDHCEPSRTQIECNLSKLNPCSLSSNIYLATPSIRLQVRLGMFDLMSSTETVPTYMCSLDFTENLLPGCFQHNFKWQIGPRFAPRTPHAQRLPTKTGFVKLYFIASARQVASTSAKTYPPEAARAYSAPLLESTSVANVCY